jgi:hypothetical protein
LRGACRQGGGGIVHMILCEWDASEGHPGQSCVHLYARSLSTSFTSVSIFSVWCYSSVSISLYVQCLPASCRCPDPRCTAAFRPWDRPSPPCRGRRLRRPAVRETGCQRTPPPLPSRSSRPDHRRHRADGRWNTPPLRFRRDRPPRRAVVDRQKAAAVHGRESR